MCLSVHAVVYRTYARVCVGMSVCVGVYVCVGIVIHYPPGSQKVCSVLALTRPGWCHLQNLARAQEWNLTTPPPNRAKSSNVSPHTEVYLFQLPATLSLSRLSVSLPLSFFVSLCLCLAHYLFLSLCLTLSQSLWVFFSLSLWLSRSPSQKSPSTPIVHS